MPLLPLQDEMEHDENEEVDNLQDNEDRPALQPDDEQDLPRLEVEVRRRRRKKKKKFSLGKKSADSESQQPTIVNFDQSLPSSHSVSHRNKQ